MSYISNSFDEKIIEILKAGGVGFMPSDTIYGLSARALDETAVEKIHALKKRDAGKPFIVLISSLHQLDELGVMPPPKSVADDYWPGALSIECDAVRAPAWLHRGIHHFAVRMPDQPQLLELIEKVGPIISTSANIGGETPINSVTEAEKKFGDGLDFYVDAGDLGEREPSTLVVIKDGRIEVVRKGAVKIDEKEKMK